MLTQKQLTQEEILNFTLDKAKSIVSEYLRFESQNNLNVYEFENVLPWKKSDIIMSFLKILQEADEKKIKNICSGKIIEIIETFTFSPEDYKKILEIKEVSGLILDSEGNPEKFLDKFKEKHSKK